MKNVRLLHDIVKAAASAAPHDPALIFREAQLDFSQLLVQVEQFAELLAGAGLAADERVAVYLPKQFETVVTIFGAAAAGGCIVPINPLLKPQQVGYILQNCNVRLLVTSGERAAQLAEVVDDCHDLLRVILTSPLPAGESPVRQQVDQWRDFLDGPTAPVHRRIDTDMAAILYTSGSTGLPKGVVLSHRNMVAAAESTAEFLELRASDRLLAVLPLSFDYGLSQLTSAYSAGASVVLIDYLFPREVVKAVVRHRVTGLSAVPPIWNQLAVLDWPPEAAESMRYLTTSGGVSRKSTIVSLREKLPNTRIFKMYGLTEAFRSSYLPPEEIDSRPESVGRAVPGARLAVVREDGSLCAPGEPGELVHRGTLVAMGYWNDPARTAERFRPAPGQLAGIPITELAVWSGDQMKMDAEGYLYFVSRKDEMIKTSGYRVSPTEVEDVVFNSGLAAEAVAIGVPHPELGQAIVLAVLPADGKELQADQIVEYCRRELPSYMVPAYVEVRDALPRNPNGKIDRLALQSESKERFCVARD